MSEHPTSNELIEQIRRAHASACPKPTENPAWTNCHVDCGILLAELDRQRAEIERLTRENEDFLDERQRRIHEILRLRAALNELQDEAQAVMHGEHGSDWADHFAPLFNLIQRAKALVSGEPSADETGEKRAYYETHDPPHCPTCGCGR